MMRLHCCLLTALTVFALGCAGRAPQPAGGLPEVGALEELSRHGSLVEYTTVNGADALTTSGEPSAVVDTLDNTRLVLDGDLAPDGFAWAIWRVTLAEGQAPLSVDVSFSSIGLRRYWLAWANFTDGRWEFVTGADVTEFGIKGALAGITPAEPEDMLSPTRGIYVAVISRPGQSPSSVITVSQLEAAYDVPVPPDPIFDDFENNDGLDDVNPHPVLGVPHPLTVTGSGSIFRASIHETQVQMQMPGEGVDRYDYYILNAPPGKQVTITLRHEPQNHFLEFPPPSDFTDLDLYFYNGGETDFNNFVEAKSSTQVFPGGFEHVFLGSHSGEFRLGIVPDTADGGYEDNAEYELGVFYSDSAFTVSGTVKQNGAVPMTDFTVFLEPGNFNDDTWMDGDEGPGSRGEFSIPGVPPGDYTLRVAGGARHQQSGYIYEAFEQITVAGPVTQNIDIEQYAGP